ncbi:Lysophospholipid acyltransferase [hydrothermal vent metagenome]|uniref:Lysophospholipid acyltransferase n=1 Tax=hydrothermal vent metagenome TaxID=652676 RepID=A0A3B1AIV4_9ZZZZ
MSDTPEKSANWKEGAERSNSFTLKLICWIALNIGRPTARMVLYPITAYFFFTSPKVIRASKYYFKRLRGSRASFVTVAKHIHHFSATILDRVFFLTDQHDKFEIKIHGKDIFDKYMAQGKGGILLGSHHGSFEVLRSLAVKHTNVRLKVLMYREHNQMITQIFDKLNPDVAQTVINLADNDALLQMQQAIEEGFFVGMLGDRVTGGERKAECSLLGESVDFPAGPMLIASILKVPIVLFYGLYQGGNRYDLYFELLTDGLKIDRSKREQEVQQWTQKYVSRLEHYIIKSPYNWFNFYDFWNDENK